MLFSCKSFRVRRNRKGLSLIRLVRLLQVARGSGELELTDIACSTDSLRNVYSIDIVGLKKV